jgi:hypothetical protein
MRNRFLKFAFKINLRRYSPEHALAVFLLHEHLKEHVGAGSKWRGPPVPRGASARVLSVPGTIHHGSGQDDD